MTDKTDNDNDLQDADEEDDAAILASNTKPYTLQYVHTDHQIALLRHSEDLNPQLAPLGNGGAFESRLYRS